MHCHFGILLFLLTGGLSGQAKEFQEWMTPKSKEMMVDYSSNYDIEEMRKQGKKREKSAEPVTSDQYNEITQKLEKYGIERIWCWSRYFYLQCAIR